jgi:hypothetical protein
VQHPKQFGHRQTVFKQPSNRERELNNPLVAWLPAGIGPGGGLQNFSRSKISLKSRQIFPMTHPAASLRHAL